MKRSISLIVCITALIAVFAIPASANNNTDVDFNIPITSTAITTSSTTNARRVKRDTSATYINYTKMANGTTAATGPYKFVAVIFGSYTYGGTYVDCTSYVHNSSGTVIGYRTPAVVTKNTVGFVHQDVCEIYGNNSYGRIYGRAYSNSYTGTAKGCWSVDSVGSYSYYNTSVLY